MHKKQAVQPLLVFWAFLCFFPITIASVSVNYIFALTPIFFLILRLGLKLPSVQVTSLIYLFSLILLGSLFCSFMGFDDQIINLDRRLISYLLFLSMFAFCFCSWDERTTDAFYLGLVLVVICLCMSQITRAILLDVRHLDGESAKNIVGTQRIGFLYIAAFWIVLFRFPAHSIFGFSVHSLAMFKYSLLVVIFLGLVLTFSRSSILAFVASGIVYMFLLVLNSQKPFSTVLILGLASCTFAFAVIQLLSWLLPETVNFFSFRLVELFLSGNIWSEISYGHTSEGQRLIIWQECFRYLYEHPLFGSGFLGTWAATEYGSAHNQFVDTLLRLGFFGFAAFTYFQVKAIFSLRRTNPEIFVAFIGVLTYGMFHETFKESYGAALLALMFASWNLNFSGDNAR